MTYHIRKRIFLSIALLIGCFLFTHHAVAQEEEESPPRTDVVSSTSVSAEIDISQRSPKIDSLMYGHFIENLFSWFEGGLWAEMLGDRKFFYPVNNKEELDPPNSRDWILGQWWPIGPASAIKMDTGRPYVGEHAPRIHVESDSPRGIEQPGLPLEAGQEYEGRVILASTTSIAGDSGPTVEVSLVWGEEADARQSISIDTLSAKYEKYNFDFTSPVDTDNGRIEITGTGTGSFLVGATSLMPADNISGFRPDLISLLREMNVTMLRWGGNHSSGYEWRDGIGDRDKRPPRYDHAWDAVDQNNVGTFEFLKLCELIDAEPNIGVNAGFGDAWSAKKWVEYVNGSTDTPMGALRAKHGHPKPFDVEWWGIGNEMFGEWQLGYMSLEHFVVKHNMFSRRMQNVDPDLTLVAPGATPYSMDEVEEANYNKPVEYGSQYDWTGGLLEHSAKYFDYVSEHVYPSPRSYFSEEKQRFVEIENPALINVVRRPANRVRGAVEAWRTYEERMPRLKSSDIKIVWDEWITAEDGIIDALGVATFLNEMFRYTELFKMSAYTCAPCALTYNGTESAFRADGLVFTLYSSHFGKVPVAIDGDSPQKELRGTIGVDKPKQSSGSPTYPLDVMAAISRDESTLTISVVNPTGSEQNLNLFLAGGDLGGQAQKWTITGPNVQADNEIDEGLQVTLEKRESEDLGSPISVEPLTVNLFKVPLEDVRGGSQ